MPKPPVRPITWTVSNRTPQEYGALITGFACDYVYSDNDTERVAAPYPQNIPSGQSKSETATKIKCVVKCHVVIRVEDQKGTHMIDRIYSAGEPDFSTDCPDTHTSDVGGAPKPPDSASLAVLGLGNFRKYVIK